MSVLPPTSKRVSMHTNKSVNQRIGLKTINSVNRYKSADFEALTKRIDELDREWDIERVLEVNAAAVVFLSSIFSFKCHKWLYVTTAVSLFLMQHALMGWCPSLPVIRHAGVRTSEEINDEKSGIKSIRGDYGNGYL